MGSIMERLSIFLGKLFVLSLYHYYKQIGEVKMIFRSNNLKNAIKKLEKHQIPFELVKVTTIGIGTVEAIKASEEALQHWQRSYTQCCCQAFHDALRN